MRRITSVYTPYLNDVENKDRRSIIEGSRGLNTTTVLLVTASAIVLNSIKIHDKVFGTAKEASVDLIEDITIIAKSLMFDLNEIIHLDMELADSMIKSILNRLYPILQISTTSELVLLLNSNSGISVSIVDELTKQSYLSNELFNSVTNLFSLVDRYNIEYTGDNELICNKKL